MSLLVEKRLRVRIQTVCFSFGDIQVYHCISDFSFKMRNSRFDTFEIINERSKLIFGFFYFRGYFGDHLIRMLRDFVRNGSFIVSILPPRSN